MNQIRPEWAMVGWQADGFCWLLASRELESSELDWVRSQYNFASWDEFLRPGAFRPRWHIDIVGTGQWTIIRGATYAECLADLLFKHGWRADGDQAALPTHDVLAGHLAATASVNKAREIEAQIRNQEPTQ